MNVYYSSIQINMALTGVRPKGVDHNGNDQFVVRLSDEFLSKDECVTTIGKVIDEYIASLDNFVSLSFYESKQLFVDRLEELKASIGRFWEYSARSNALDAYVLQCYDITFCLMRVTSWRGWYHSVCLGTHRESWISFGERDYDIIYSSSIEDGYAVNHKFDQVMFDHVPKHARGNTSGFVFPFGSTMYAPEVKADNIQTQTTKIALTPNAPPVKPEDVMIPKQDANGNYIPANVDHGSRSIRTQHGRKLVLKTKL